MLIDGIGIPGAGGDSIMSSWKPDPIMTPSEDEVAPIIFALPQRWNSLSSFRIYGKR